MTVEQNIETPGVQTAKSLLHKYGLGTLFAANVLGAGSVYILAQTGASVGFALLWVLPLAFAFDMVMHDMSSRMAVNGRPLMEYIRESFVSMFGYRWGMRASKTYAVIMALVMQLWAVANYAVAGAAVSWFTGVSIVLCIYTVAMIGVLLVLTRTYNVAEAIISAMLLTVFTSYAALTFGLDINTSQVLSGFVPGVSDATLIIAMLGTTVYYPNFFIQSSMRPTKEWVDISKYRRDNAVGVMFSVLVSAGMLAVAAVVLSPGELSLTDPARPLTETVGQWSLPVFMGAVLAASFTSATGTLFGSGFAVPQAHGQDTEFGDFWFTITVVLLIGLSAGIAVLALEFTQMTPVRMAITMPALNGAIFLPLTILTMYMATKDEMGIKQKIISGIAVFVMFAGSALTVQSLADQVMAWM